MQAWDSEVESWGVGSARLVSGELVPRHLSPRLVALGLADDRCA